MSSVAILLLADTESHGDLGRAANALETVKELKEHGDDVRLIFDGAATKWVVKLDGTEHKLSPLFAAVRDRVAGACAYCAGAFGVQDGVSRRGIALLDEYEGHPSVRRLIADGYQVITF
jgi:hypothetical protein